VEGNRRSVLGLIKRKRCQGVFGEIASIGNDCCQKAELCSPEGITGYLSMT
jgi:hypothetical protein